MVLILLSSIPPSLTPTSAAASSLSPHSPRAPAHASPFFAILSPLFDYNGPDDAAAAAAAASSSSPSLAAYAQSLSSPAAQAPRAEPAHAAAAAAPVRPRLHRVPALKPAPAGGRATPLPLPPASPRNVDKRLPPTPNSPAYRSPLQYSHTFSHRAKEVDLAALERQRLRSVPSVQVSGVVPQITTTVAEVIDAEGSHVVRSANSTEHLRSSSSPRSPRFPPSSSSNASTPLAAGRPATPSTASTASTLSPARSLFPRRGSALRDPSPDASTKASVSVAMSGVDLDIPSSATSSTFSIGLASPLTAGTPHTAASALFPHYESKLSLAAPEQPPRSPLPAAHSMPCTAMAAAFDDVDSMEVPLAIDTFLLPDSLPLETDKPLPAAPLLAPAPAPATRSKHRKAASTSASAAWRRGTIFQPLEEIGKPIGCA